MTPDEYELLTAELIQRLAERNADLGIVEWCAGRRCKEPGSSGYGHQIDVAGRGPKVLVLIECKRWTKRIGVAEVLVLAARKRDIEALNCTKTVWTAMVSTKAASRDAKTLAEHFGISIDTVANAQEFAVRLFDRIHVGMRDGAVAGDRVSAVVLKASELAQPRSPGPAR